MALIFVSPCVFNIFPKVQPAICYVSPVPSQPR
jgi:hypothetical protein